MAAGPNSHQLPTPFPFAHWRVKVWPAQSSARPQLPIERRSRAFIQKTQPVEASLQVNACDESLSAGFARYTASTAGEGETAIGSSGRSEPVLALGTDSLRHLGDKTSSQEDLSSGTILEAQDTGTARELDPPGCVHRACGTSAPGGFGPW